MPIQVTAEGEFMVGTPVVLEAETIDGPWGCVFEDDGETAYFYALDFRNEQQPIVNALHIYNVANVTDREKPSVAKIGWSADGSKAVLLINQWPHAVFDFAGQRGYCRTGFPPPAKNSGWTGHEWDEAAVGLFA